MVVHIFILIKAIRRHTTQELSLRSGTLILGKSRAGIFGYGSKIPIAMSFSLNVSLMYRWSSESVASLEWMRKNGSTNWYLIYMILILRNAREIALPTCDIICLCLHIQRNPNLAGLVRIRWYKSNSSSCHNLSNPVLRYLLRRYISTIIPCASKPAACATRSHKCWTWVSPFPIRSRLSKSTCASLQYSAVPNYSQFSNNCTIPSEIDMVMFVIWLPFYPTYMDLHSFICWDMCCYCTLMIAHI